MNQKPQYSLKIFATKGKLTPINPEYFEIKDVKSRPNTVCFELKKEQMTEDNNLTLKEIDKFTTSFSGKSSFLSRYFQQSYIQDEPTVLIYKVKQDYIKDKTNDIKLKPLFQSELAQCLLNASDIFGATLNHRTHDYQILKNTCWKSLFLEDDIFSFYDYLNIEGNDATVSPQILEALKQYYQSLDKPTPNKENIKARKVLEKLAATKLHEYGAMRGLLVSYLDYQDIYDVSYRNHIQQDINEKPISNRLMESSDLIFNLETFEKRFLTSESYYVSGFSREQREQFDMMINHLKKLYRKFKDAKNKWETEEKLHPDMVQLLKDNYKDREKEYLEALSYGLQAYQLFQDMRQVSDDSIEGLDQDLESGNITVPIQFVDGLQIQKRK